MLTVAIDLCHLSSRSTSGSAEKQLVTTMDIASNVTITSCTHRAGSSLRFSVQAWGVQVKEVWSVDSQLPATPMGNVDRSAATFFNGDVRVFEVDEDARKLRSLEQPVC